MTKDVITVTPKTDLKDLKEMFERYDFNGFPVVDGGRVVGVVTKLDLLKAFSAGLNVSLGRFMKLYSDETADIMHTATIHVSSGDDISKAADYMVEFKLRSMPVIDGGELKGIISRKDIIGSLKLE